MKNTDKREIRKRIDPALTNFKDIYGCYVNAAGEIVSTMKLPVLDMSTEEREQYADLFRKAVSGSPGKNLFDIDILPGGMESSDHHKLMMSLRDSHIEDDGLRSILYERIIEKIDTNGKSYVILLAADTYDILPKDNDDDEWSEESEQQFEYFICSICQVKDPKAALRYKAEPKTFRGASTGSVLASPVAGFMFPAFTDRQADIGAAWYYSKSKKDNQADLIRGLFGTETPPLSAEMKKAVFGEVLRESLGHDCTLDVITGVQARISAKIGENEGENSAVTPKISVKEVCSVLRDKGVPEPKISSFAASAEEKLGPGMTAETLLQRSDFKITSSEAKISVDPLQALRIKTRVIDGITYFLVPTGSDVKVNGIEISTSEK